ncbi:MAG: HD-GYP domain-containing protein [Phycisphaerales bacterium]|nr:HD-GYP domain-containing protein [Phycisphaerales bacterium]
MSSNTAHDCKALLHELAQDIAARDAAAAAPAHKLSLNPLEHLERLSHGIGQLADENSRLVDEVLQGYEHLNLVFDFTQNLAETTDRAQLERQLMTRICLLLKARAACLVEQGGAPRWYEASSFRPDHNGKCNLSDQRLDSEFASRLAARTRDQRKIDVITSGEYQILAGPLTRLDDRVDAMLAFRSVDAQPFTSSEMLMVETALSFGSRVICHAEAHERLRKMSIEVSRALVAAIDKKDHYTCGHSERVALLARATGETLGLTANDLQTIEWAGLLHDVGKIGIPEAILCKPGKLTDEEFDVIKRHPRMGYEILRPIASFDRVLEAVLYHHEQPDGRGYPEGLHANEIPLLARIIHVVDVFDALTSTRSYRNAFSVEQAIDIIRKDSGTRIDSEMASAFERAITAMETENPAGFRQMFRTDAVESAGAG